MSYNDPLIILITGASGSGKTSVAKELEQYFPLGEVAVYYFDDIGVPSIDKMIEDYGSSEKWQQWATHAWIERLQHITDKKYIFLEGSFYPEFALQKMQELNIKHYLIICLYAERKIRESRLLERNQLELITQDMENFAVLLKEKTLKSGGKVIDSSQKSISDILTDISNLILIE